MSNFKRDPSLDALLNLNGESFAIDDSTSPHWVKFVVNRIKATPEKPHGLDYLLTLHAPNGDRIIGFDNALLWQKVPGLVAVLGFNMTTSMKRTR